MSWTNREIDWLVTSCFWRHHRYYSAHLIIDYGYLIHNSPILLRVAFKSSDELWCPCERQDVTGCRSNKVQQWRHVITESRVNRVTCSPSHVFTESRVHRVTCLVFLSVPCTLAFLEPGSLDDADSYLNGVSLSMTDMISTAESQRQGSRCTSERMVACIVSCPLKYLPVGLSIYVCPSRLEFDLCLTFAPFIWHSRFVSCLSITVFVYLPACLSVCLPVRLCACHCVYFFQYLSWAALRFSPVLRPSVLGRTLSDWLIYIAPSNRWMHSRRKAIGVQMLHENEYIHIRTLSIDISNLPLYTYMYMHLCTVCIRKT